MEFIFSVTLAGWIQIVGAFFTVILHHLKENIEKARESSKILRFFGTSGLTYVALFTTFFVSVVTSANMHEDSMRKISDQNRILTTIKKSMFNLEGMTVSYTLEIPADGSQYRDYVARVDGDVRKTARALVAASENSGKNRSNVSSIDGVALSRMYPGAKEPVVQEVEIHDESPLFPKGRTDGLISSLMGGGLQFKFYKRPLPQSEVSSVFIASGGSDRPPKNYDPVKDYKRPVWSPDEEAASTDWVYFFTDTVSAKNRKFYYALNRTMYVEAINLLDTNSKGHPGAIVNTDPSFRRFFPVAGFSTLDDLIGSAIYIGTFRSVWGGVFDGKIVELSFTIKNGPRINIDCSKIQAVVNSDGTRTYSYVFPNDAGEFDKLVSNPISQ